MANVTQPSLEDNEFGLEVWWQVVLVVLVGGSRWGIGEWGVLRSVGGGGGPNLDRLMVLKNC